MLPDITIMIVTLNNERTLETCLKAIKNQDYPKKKIEYLNIDGCSTDNTEKILRNYGYKIIKSSIPRNAEAQRGIGLKYAKNNLIVSIDADNYLPTPFWLRQMVKPFMDDPKIVHANTIYYTYKKDDTLFNRYFALFGMVDPIVYYVGRPDRLPQYIKKWTLGKIIKETSEYIIVDFNLDTLPTVGCNGVVYKKDILLKYAQSKPEQFLHIDIFADLIANGFNRFAIVKNDVIHDTAVDLKTLMKKRIAFLKAYYLKVNASGQKRRYLIYNPIKIKDVSRLFLFVLYTVTWVRPIIDSLRGYMVIKDVAWFLHPIMCWVYLYAYSVATIRKVIFKIYV